MAPRGHEAPSAPGTPSAPSSPLSPGGTGELPSGSPLLLASIRLARHLRGPLPTWSVGGSSSGRWPEHHVRPGGGAGIPASRRGPAWATSGSARGQTRLSAPRRCGRCGRVGLIDLGRGLCPVCSRRPSSTPVSVHWMPVPPPLVGAQAATRHICRRRRVSREHGLDPAESRRLFPRRFHSLAPEVGEVLASFCQGQSGTEAFAKEAPGRAGGSWCRWPSPHPPVATVPAGPGRRVPPFIVEGF